MREGDLRHRLGISRVDMRYFAKHRRWGALARSLWLTQVLRDYGERCDMCGRPMRLLWWSPTPLWTELYSDMGGGCLCPRCYNDVCEKAGIRVIWTPMVAGRYEAGKLVPTTNWWLSDTRDWLMMGVPDPECFDRERDENVYPTQWPWKRIKDEMQDVIPPPQTAAYAKQEAPPEERVDVRSAASAPNFRSEMLGASDIQSLAAGIPSSSEPPTPEEKS